MSEKVSLTLERFVAELRDLEEKQVFTPNEISEMVQSRTAHETLIIRSACTPQNFIDYVNYEVRLEKLRKIRSSKLQIKPGSSISTYSIPRHVTHILTIATRRFPTSNMLWSKYIDHIRSLKAPRQLSKVLVQAISAQPNTAKYWLLAIRHEKSEGDVAVARKLLMRAVRFLKKDFSIWEEWIDFEVAFAEETRVRLGHEPPSSHKGKGKEIDGEELPLSDGEALQEMQEEVQQVEKVGGERAVTEGAIVKIVINHALDSLLAHLLQGCKLNFFRLQRSAQTKICHIMSR